MREYYTITPEDVNKRFLRIFNKGWLLSDLCGYIQLIDVGKRIYLINGILQMENQEQFTRRMWESLNSKQNEEAYHE
jgi:hypothetical protein